MKQSEFKEAAADRWVLLKANFIFTFQKETAYWANNWTSLLSTTFYTLSMLVFINILYSKKTLNRQYNKDRYIKFIFKDMPGGEEIKTLGTMTEFAKNYCMFKVKGDELPQIISKVTSHYEIIDIEILSTPLDDIIADIYQKSSQD